MYVYDGNLCILYGMILVNKPLFSPYGCHGGKACPVFDVAWLWLWSLYATLGYIEGDVDAGSQGPSTKANTETA